MADAGSCGHAAKPRTIAAAPVHDVIANVGPGGWVPPGAVVASAAADGAPDGSPAGSSVGCTSGDPPSPLSLATAASNRSCASTSCAPPTRDRTSIPTAANRKVGTSGWNDGRN